MFEISGSKLNFRKFTFFLVFILVVVKNGINKQENDFLFFGINEFS